MRVPVPTAQKIRFRAFELDRQTAELWKNGTKLKLQGQPIAVLTLLLERPGELVTREELRRHLWPEDTFVDFEHSLNTHIKKLRQVFDDDAETPCYIETLPRRGYRFIAQVEAIPNGNAAVEEVPGVAASPDSEPAPLSKPRRWKYRVVVLAACALLGGLLYVFAVPRIAQLIRLHQLQQLTMVPLTALPGNVASPTFSPDGSQIAFAWDGENNGAGYDLYVKVIGREKPLRLTNHPSQALSAAWSPDGRNIAFARSADPENSEVFLISPLGGPEKKVATKSWMHFLANELSWSADGKRLAFVDHPSDSKSWNSFLLFELSLDTLRRTLVQTHCTLVVAPAFSPRGDYLAWVCVDSFDSVSLNVERLSDGRTTKLLRWPDAIEGIAWSNDSSRIAFSSDRDFGSLWEVYLDQPNQIERLPVGHDATDLAVSPARNGLAFTQNRRNVNIWRLDLAGPQLHAKKVVTSSREEIAPDISPDGAHIAFGSNRTGNNEVWVCDADGSNPVQLSSFGIQMTGTPRWSPDGKLIAFDSRIGGEANIYIVDPHEGVPRKVNIDIRGNNLPSWSHDGKWIYFDNGEDSQQETVWKVPSIGGHAVQLAAQEAIQPIESPDGKYVYFVRHLSLWRVRPDGGAAEAVPGMPQLSGGGDAWFPTETGIYFLSQNSNTKKAEVKFFDLKSRTTRVIYVMEKDPPWIYIGGLPVSSDRKWLLFPQVDEQSSDLMLIENWH